MRLRLVLLLCAVLAMAVAGGRGGLGRSCEPACRCWTAHGLSPAWPGGSPSSATRWASDDPRRDARRRRPRHRVPPRAGPLLPDGPDAPARRRRAGGAGRARAPSRPIATIRIHRLPRGGRAAVDAAAAPRTARCLDAYAAGVNAGLAALERHAVRYLLLRQAPEPWRPKTACSWCCRCSSRCRTTTARTSRRSATMHDVLPPEMVDFLAPPGTEWDAPVVGPAVRSAARPGAGHLRPAARADRQAGDPIPPVPDVAQRQDAHARGHDPSDARSAATTGRSAGSSPATAARWSPTTCTCVRVPNTWYRARARMAGSADAGERRTCWSASTLPGVPALVVGSNTHVAWGFTNTYADWSDIVLLELDPRTPTGTARPTAGGASTTSTR